MYVLQLKSALCMQASMADQPMEQQKPVLSEEMLKVIHGRVDQGDKREKYQESLGRYAMRRVQSMSWGGLVCLEVAT